MVVIFFLFTILYGRVAWFDNCLYSSVLLLSVHYVAQLHILPSSLRSLSLFIILSRLI